MLNHLGLSKPLKVPLITSNFLDDGTTYLLAQVFQTLNCEVKGDWFDGESSKYQLHPQEYDREILKQNRAWRLLNHPLSFQWTEPFIQFIEPLQPINKRNKRRNVVLHLIRVQDMVEVLSSAVPALFQQKQRGMPFQTA